MHNTKTIKKQTKILEVYFVFEKNSKLDKQQESWLTMQKGSLQPEFYIDKCEHQRLYIHY